MIITRARTVKHRVGDMEILKLWEPEGRVDIGHGRGVMCVMHEAESMS